MSFAPGMPPSELKIWAREELLSCIDAKIADMMEHGRDGHMIDLEDEIVLTKERDRVAKLFNLPTKYK